MARIQEVYLNFDNLQHLDNGKLDLLLRSQLAIAARDCVNRPFEKKRRRVSLVFMCVPILGPDGECEGAKLVVQCKSRVPDYQSREYEMRATNDGFRFNRDFPDSLDQKPLFDKGDEP